MEAERRTKKCSACGGEAVYVHDVALTQDKILVPEWTLTALYRCTHCGHFDFYEREGDRETKELEDWIQNTPDYRCPACGQVGKSEQCAYCGRSCLPVKRSGEAQREKAPEPKKKKRRWFGRDDDKPDWEG